MRRPDGGTVRQVASKIKGLTATGPHSQDRRRAAARLPSRFGLTVRGLGRLKHLDLEG